MIFFPFAVFDFVLRDFNPNFALAASLASFLLFSSFALFSAGDSGISSLLTPCDPTDAPRIRSRPSFRVSVITGEAAGRYLCSSEYLPESVASPLNEIHEP